MKTRVRARDALASAMVLALGLAVAGPAAHAQDKASVSRSETAKGTVVVKSIDRPGRHLVVVSDKGEEVSLKVPAEARNFESIKPGDKIAVTYTLSTEYVLSAPNTALPPDTDDLLVARAAKGEVPAGYVANHVVVTGAVVGIDQAAYTFKLVSTEGGAVHTVSVKTDAGRRAMAKMKVGDTITAYISESMLLTVDPA
jgi:hypothetical protein